MPFKIKGEILEIEIIATGHGIKNLNRLNKVHGKGSRVGYAHQNCGTIKKVGIAHPTRSKAFAM